MAKSIIRVSALIILSIVALFGIFCTPMENSATWSFDFFISKSLGFLAVWMISKLYPRWAETDKWISIFDKWCSDGSEEEED